jgi:hypothetical protein
MKWTWEEKFFWGKVKPLLYVVYSLSGSVSPDSSPPAVRLSKVTASLQMVPSGGEQ